VSTGPVGWTADESRELYDRIGDLSARLLGDNIHCGYWSGPDDGSSMQQATDRLTDMLIERLDVVPGQRVLDVGCGNGRPAVRLVRARRVDVVGITISRHHLEQATARAHTEGLDGRVRFQLADVTESSSLTPASYDAAFAIESVTLIPDRARAFRQIARALRPGARLVEAGILLRAPAAGAGAAFLEWFCHLLMRPPFGTMDEYRWHARDAGLEVEELADVTEHVLERSFAAVIEGLRGDAGRELAGLGMPPGEIEEMATAAARFVEMPEAAYGILVARRPRA
jgi:cyclopropane fatty-acyl-phospholipid synthase-like methyltransferase